METIFDHNPTEQELTEIFGRVVTKEEHLAVPRDQVTEHAYTLNLFTSRQDAPMIAKYRALIPADYLRTCLDLNDLLPA